MRGSAEVAELIPHHRMQTVSGAYSNIELPGKSHLAKVEGRFPLWRPSLDCFMRRLKQ